MPGLVLPPQPTLVMPQTLCLAFTEDREYAQLRNEYHDATPQASQLAQTSRKTFKLSRRLTPSQLSTLWTFWESLNGGLYPFIFYNPFDDTPIGSNYDPTGVNTQGRYIVAFRNNWTQASSIRRSDVTGLELIEVAPMDPTYEMFAGFGSHGSVTDSTLNILTSHTLGDPSTSIGAICSIDGLSLFSRGWLSGSGAWTLRTDTHAFSPVFLSTLRIIFAINTAGGIVDLTTPEDFLVYDCWVSITFADLSTALMRPTIAEVNPSVGTVTNPDNAMDGSTSTFSLIERTHLNTIDFSSALILSALALT